jgi:glycosyltransferase involved in cell wall biosynthesis
LAIESGAMEIISVCICTYKRPELLYLLLNELADQSTNLEFDFRVVVVDNDAKMSAQDIIQKIMIKFPKRIDYFCEPKQNISTARNLALKNSNGDYIAFIDDDELPNKDWLLNLYRKCVELNCDGIQGQVIPRFSNEVPQWVVKGRFYQKPCFNTGYVLNWKDGCTANLLIKSKIIKDGKLDFDPRFGSGGEDRDFLRRCIEKGYVIKFCKEACVQEIIPPARWKRKFMIKRALLRGNVAILSPDFNICSLLKSITAVFIYTAFLPILILSEHYLFMKYVVKNFDHLGKIFAFIGLNFIKQKYIIE